MKTSEVSALLTMAAAFDNRTVGEANVAAWAMVLPEEMRLADAMEALKAHFAQSLDYLRPPHINDGVRALHKLRMRSVPPPQDMAPDDADMNGIDYQAWQKAYWDSAKAGSLEPHVVADAQFGIKRGPLHAPQLERMQRLLTSFHEHPQAEAENY